MFWNKSHRTMRQFAENKKNQRSGWFFLEYQVPPAGLEPAISRLEGGCLIHWATGRHTVVHFNSNSPVTQGQAFIQLLNIH